MQTSNMENQIEMIQQPVRPESNGDFSEQRAERASPDFDRDESETFAELMRIAQRRTGAIPPELIVEKVLEVAKGGDWPLLRAALEALLRRFTFARRDELAVLRRPSNKSGLGLYETRRKASGRKQELSTKRPYRTLLSGVEPLQGSCDCPDYQRSGLGLCKHLLVVIDELAKKPVKWERAKVA